jgi:pilus assembly protein Flp/PilA
LRQRLARASLENEGIEGGQQGWTLPRRAAVRLFPKATRRFSAKATDSMNDLCSRVLRFLRDDDGPTTVEYAMMIMLVLLAILSAITVLGQTTADSFESSNDSIEEAIDARP